MVPLSAVLCWKLSRPPRRASCPVCCYTEPTAPTRKTKTKDTRRKIPPSSRGLPRLPLPHRQELWSHRSNNAIKNRIPRLSSSQQFCNNNNVPHLEFANQNVYFRNDVRTTSTGIDQIVDIERFIIHEYCCDHLNFRSPKCKNVKSSSCFID